MGIVHRHHTKKCGCKYVYGTGFIDSLLPIALNFAKNPNSAINVGSTVADLVSTGKNIHTMVSAGKKDYSALEPNAKKLLNIIEDIKTGRGFKIV